MSDAHLLLLARTDDPAIRTLRQQAPHRLAHASIADLSRAGWRYESGRPERASACAGGRLVPVERIAAVVCRIAVVTPSDLPHVHRDDRAYVAAEITAFLRAWLAQFTGVRFNEPCWASLAGPGWHALQWTWFVAGIGVPVMVPSPPSGGSGRSERETATATVVRGEVFGPIDPTLIDYSLRIARAAKSELLAVTFVRDREWQFLSADPCPELDSISAAALVRRAFAPPARPSIEPRADALCGAA
jgi:hypothetical protein